MNINSFDKKIAESTYELLEHLRKNHPKIYQDWIISMPSGELRALREHEKAVLAKEAEARDKTDIELAREFMDKYGCSIWGVHIARDGYFRKLRAVIVQNGRRHVESGELAHQPWYCCYVQLPESLIGSIETIVGDIKCHGGVTKTGKIEWIGEPEFWVGWDYNHWGDKFDEINIEDLWAECATVAYQLLKMEWAAENGK